MDISSPVVDDVTVRTVRTNMLIRGWESEVIDVTTGFLYGDMEEEVYMQLPQGIDTIFTKWDKARDCTRLLWTIYGTKQVARQYWNKFMNVMKT
jgi:hypothetical protein